MEQAKAKYTLYMNLVVLKVQFYAHHARETNVIGLASVTMISQPNCSVCGNLGPTYCSVHAAHTSTSKPAVMPNQTACTGTSPCHKMTEVAVSNVARQQYWSH